MQLIDQADEYHTDDLNRFNSTEFDKYMDEYNLFGDTGFTTAGNLLSELETIANKLQELNVENAKPTYDIVAQKLNVTKEHSEARMAELKTLRTKIVENETLCKKFADSAQRIASFLEVQKDKSSSATGDNLEETIKILQEVSTTLESNGKEFMQELEGLDNEINSRNIIENSFTTQSYRGLKANYDSFLVLINKKLNTAKDQLESKGKTGLSQEEYSDIKESFEFFDKDKDGKLGPLDFFGVLKYLGENFTEQGAHDLLNQLDVDKDGLLNFKEYLEYIILKRSDKDTVEAYAQAFEVISGGRPFVTEDDLRRSGMPMEKIDYLKRVMPIKEGLEGITGYDYQSWLKTTH
jgi:Ca2+-binding EF-hand superfamily protein